MMNTKRLLGLGMIALAFFQFNAYALQFGLSTEFSNGTAPTGQTPWAMVNITDDGKGVLVTLSIANNDIGKLSEWYLNFNQQQDPTKLEVKTVDTAAVGSWSAAEGVNKFKADGDGTYDIKFSFATSGNVFQAGESLTFRISSKTSSDDLNPEDFNAVSVGGAKGSFHTAAHVQALSIGGGSGWIGDPQGSNNNGVPDGSWTVTLLGMGVVSLEFLRRKLRKA